MKNKQFPNGIRPLTRRRYMYVHVRCEFRICPRICFNLNASVIRLSAESLNANLSVINIEFDHT